MLSRWPSTLLGEHVNIQTGFPFKSDFYSEAAEDIRLLRGDNVVQGTMRWDNAKRWPLSRTQEVTQYSLREGDVVLAMDRPWIEAGLKYARVLVTDLPALLVQRVARLRGSVNLDQRFLYYLIGSRAFTDHVLGIQTGTAVPHISASQIAAFSFKLPSVEEQRSIAEILGSLDDKIECNRQTCRTLERVSQMIFQAWFVDFEPVKSKAVGALSFPGMPQSIFDTLPTQFVESDLGRIPKDWQVKSIGDLVSLRGGSTPSTSVEAYWKDGTHCWLTPKDLSGVKNPVLLATDRKITDEGLDKISSGLLPVGTVLLSSRAPVGYLVVSGIPTAINQGFIAMVCDGALPPLYIYHWTRSVMDEIKSRASGTTFPEISKAAFRPIRVLLPSAAILSAFDDLVSPMFDSITAACKETTRLTTLRDYLLPELLSESVGVPT